MWITLDQIECLKGVAETGSLNAASERLHKAKSAVSYSIKKLEEQLDFTVFERSGYRLTITRKGQEFLDKAAPLLQEANELKNYAEQLQSGVELQLSLSCTELFPLKEFNQILGKTLKTFPQTQLTYQREILSGEKLLEQNKVDLAVFESPRTPLKYEYKKIKDVPLKLVMASKHLFAQSHSSDQRFDQLLRFPQIVQRSTIPDPQSRGVQEKAIKWYVTDTLTKKQIILDGLGWGRLPDHEVDSEIKKGRLVHLKNLQLDDLASIYICRHRNREHGKVSEFIWDCFQ